MNYFHRTKKDNTLIGFIALVFALFLSMIFMLFGFLDWEKAGSDTGFNLIFGIVGIALFLIFCRGAWMMTSGALTHVLSVDEDKFSWGFLGREKSIPIKDLKELHWTEMDGLHVALITKNTRKVRLHYIENVLGMKSRKAFLDYFRNNHPHIKIISN